LLRAEAREHAKDGTGGTAGGTAGTMGTVGGSAPADLVARVSFLEDKVKHGTKAQRALLKTRDMLQVANQELAHSRSTNRKLQDANGQLTKQMGAARKEFKLIHHRYNAEMEAQRADFDERYTEKCQECDYLAARLRKAEDRWRRHVEERRWRHREEGGSTPAPAEPRRDEGEGRRRKEQHKDLVREFSRKIDDLSSVGRMCTAVQKKFSTVKGLEREEHLLAKIGNVVQTVEESTRLVVADYLGNPAKRRRNLGDGSSLPQVSSVPDLDATSVAKQAAVTYGVAPQRDRRSKPRSGDSGGSMGRCESLPAIVHGGRSPAPAPTKLWR